MTVAASLAQVHSLARWFLAHVAVVCLLAHGSALAAETDCMGTSADGKAVCTSPTVSGNTYSLCRSSSLYVEEGLADRCYASTVGGYGIPIKSEGTLQALINCMTGTGSPSWMSSGSANGFFCSGTVTYKYGTEVVGISQTIPYGYGHLQPTRRKKGECPFGYVPVGGTGDLPDYCKKPPKYCCDTTGNPMGIANADHSRVERDIAANASSPLEFTRYYSSSSYYRPAGAANPLTVSTAAVLELNLDWNLTPGFGDFWRHTYDRRILPEAGPYLLATASRQNGINKHFRPDGTQVINEDGRSDRLIALTDAQSVITGWRYASDEGVETYAATGELLSIHTREGRTITLLYSAAIPGQPAGLLAEVNDDAGRYLRFGYDDKYRIAAVTDSASQTIYYTYSGDFMLGGVTYPGGASRSYTYNDNPLGRQGGNYGLTGVTDEFGNRLATYGYANGSGAAYTEYIGGTARHERTAISGTQVSVTDPMGAARVYTLQTISGVPRVVSTSQPAGFGNPAATSYRGYDSAGNLTSTDGFDGSRTCYASDTSRLLETMRVEGLSNAVSCSAVLTAGATLPSGSRKISTQWHPDWRLPARRAEPGRITTYVYQGQPDPTAGNVVANCAPAGALLPGSKPVAVLCAKVEQATLDTDGAQGFSAALDGGSAARRWSHTYNTRGQVLTTTDPRSNNTAYQYYATSTATARAGDLESVTNAAGHATTYGSYHGSGLLLQSTDPNGTATSTTYDDRRRPQAVSVTSGGTVQTTTYEYYANGKVWRVTLPDGKTVTYTYDTAHRLVGVTDAAGNTVEYTLDNAGNRVAEEVKDSSGVLARNVARAFDALNRLYSISGTVP